MVRISKPYKVKDDIQKSLILKLNHGKYHGSWDSFRAFDMILCDNKIDVDGEKFSIPALFQMRDMFIGKTGICGKGYDGKDDTARIFDCTIKCDYGSRTADGEPVLYLKASAYYNLNNGSYTEFNNAVNNEYYDSVSIGCAVDKQTEHNGYTTIDSITDVYEWAFVASSKKVNCPLRLKDGKCFGSQNGWGCIYVDVENCHNFKKIYRFGLNNAPTKQEI